MPKTFAPVARGNSRLEVNNKGERAELILLGPVGGSWLSDDGIKESEVRDALKSIPKGTPIDVHINSEGGSVQEGLGIYNAFKKRSADITAYVDGYALSIASVFPLAASKVVSPKSSIWMIHEAWNFSAGNKRDKAKEIEMLETHDETMAEIYAEATGRPIEEMRTAMEAETWIRGSAAVDFGLADETDDEKSNASASYRPLPADYLKRCKNAGTVLNLFIPAPAANGDDHRNKTKNSAGAPGGAADDPMKDKIIALLKKHGTEAKEDWTGEQFDEALSKIPVAKESNDGKTILLDSKLSSEIMEMQHQLKEEKLARVTAKIESLIDDRKLTNDEKDEEIALCMANEKRLATISKRSPQSIGGTPVGGVGHEISAEDPILDLKKKEPVVAKRFKTMENDYDQIFMQACRRDIRSGAIKDPRFIALVQAGINPMTIQGMQYPMAANTITNVLTNFLIDGSVTDLQNRWAPLKAFSLDVRPDGFKPLAPGILKHVTAADAGQTNATNYESSGNSTVAPVTVTPAEHSKSWQLSSTDLNSGVRMADLVALNTAVFADLVLVAAIAPLTLANFGGATQTAAFGGPQTLVSAAGAFGYNELTILQACLKKSPIKNLILDGSYIARVANQPGYYQQAGLVAGNSTGWMIFGWDGIWNNTNWSGAAANLQGFACNPQAVGGIIGLPLLPPVIPGQILSSTTVTIDGLNIQVLAEAWFNPATRILWNSLRVMDGWAAVDKTAGFLVTSA